MRAEVYEPGHPRRVVSKANLGALYVRRGKLAEAEAALSSANAVLEQKVADDHLFRIFTDWQLAKVYARTDRVDEARRLFDRVLPIWQARPGEDTDRAEMLEDYEAFVREHGRE